MHLVIKDKDQESLIFNIFWATLEWKYLEYIKDGKIVNEYLKSRYARELAIGEYESEYEGRKIYCLNSRGNSFNFGDKVTKYPMLVLFQFNGKYNSFSYSSYSSEKYTGEGGRFECNKVAEKFGGGGHVGAAGFTSSDLIFKPISN